MEEKLSDEKPEAMSEYDLYIYSRGELGVFLEQILEEVSKDIEAKATIQQGPRFGGPRFGETDNPKCSLNPLFIETDWDFRNAYELEMKIWKMIIEFVSNKNNQVWLKKFELKM